MLGRRLFSTSLYDRAPKPKRSILVSAVKVVVGLYFVGTSLAVLGTYSGAFYTLETRKYVDVKKVQASIPKDRNIIKYPNSANFGQSISQPTKVMIAIRSQVEPTIPAETKKRFSEEAKIERDVLLDAIFFGVDKEAGDMLISEILPYFLNEDEVKSVKNYSLKKRSS